MIYFLNKSFAEPNPLSIFMLLMHLNLHKMLSPMTLDARVGVLTILVSVAAITA